MNFRNVSVFLLSGIFACVLSLDSSANPTPLSDIITVIPGGTLYAFAEPVDGVSIGVPTDEINLQVSGFVGTEWTHPEVLELEKEFDPLLRESNLILFNKATHLVKVMGETPKYDVHPIRISSAPASVEVAARLPTPLPKILSRKDWGADESILYTTPNNAPANEKEERDSNGIEPVASDTTSQRIIDCEEAQKNYPKEFKVARTEKTDGNGNSYRWTRTYSSSVKLIAIHHTAMNVTGDTRSGVERMRALYAYHANNRGWGDIGYHYIIDDEGKIYEGKSGGDYVVGGHAYCNNVGTLGIALMGNFDTEKPTQAQMHALQWLIIEMSKRYNIPLDTEVSFHGKMTSPVVRHKDLVSTACPGYYVSNSINQIRGHVIAGDANADVIFPTLEKNYTNKADERKAARQSQLPTVSSGRTGLKALGGTTLEGRPGGEVRVSLEYTAASGMQSRARIADVKRSNQRIGLYQELDGTYQRVRDEILLPESVSAGKSTTIRLRIQFPATSDSFSLDIGNITYTLQAEGRRARTPSSEPSAQRIDTHQLTNTPTPGARSRSSSSRSSASSESTIINVKPVSTSVSPTIRIRLGYTSNVASISADTPARVGTAGISSRDEIRLGKEGENCVALAGTRVLASGIVQFDPGSGVTTIESWNVPTNRFRGIIECRVVDGALALINELPLEEYLMGLSEEPDTEPYEKQRAFAIAARSYAAHYMQRENRKFPGMPYDGDDSAARFQKYSGVVFEQKNATWLRALESTRGIVIKKNGVILKTPYFSSDDGRTKSPEENGWKNFPFTEVFQSKPDPWCNGMAVAGHGVGMSGCGAKAQALEGKTAEDILKYYYPTTELSPVE